MILCDSILVGQKGSIHEATLNTADGIGRKILYDIINIRRIDKKRAADGVVSSTANGRDAHINSSSSETGAAQSTNPSPGAARKTAQVSTDSIRGENENVNGLSVKQQQRDSKGYLLSGEQREFFKDSKIYDAQITLNWYRV